MVKERGSKFEMVYHTIIIPELRYEEILRTFLTLISSLGP